GFCLALEPDDRRVWGQEGEEGVEEGRLADLSRFGGDDHRDPCLEEEPERGGQLGVEGALADERDDRTFGGCLEHVPEPTGGVATGSTPCQCGGGVPESRLRIPFSGRCRWVDRLGLVEGLARTDHDRGRVQRALMIFQPSSVLIRCRYST